MKVQRCALCRVRARDAWRKSGFNTACTSLTNACARARSSHVLWRRRFMKSPA